MRFQVLTYRLVLSAYARAKRSPVLTQWATLPENNLRDFPALICNLTLLAVLNLSHNAFTRLPLELGRLTLLRRLG